MVRKRFLAALGMAVALAVTAGSLPAFADRPDGGDRAEREGRPMTAGGQAEPTSAGVQALVAQFQQAASNASSAAQLVDLFKALAAQAGADRKAFAQALRQFMHANRGLSGVAIQASRQMDSRGDDSDAEEVLKATLEEDGQSVTGSVYGDQTVTGSTYSGDQSVSGATYGQGTTVSGAVYAGKEKEMEDAFAELGKIYERQKKTGLHVFVDGVEPSFDVQPVVQGGRTLVPVRAVGEALHATVTWDPTAASVTLKGNGHTLVFTVGSKTAVVDGQSVTLDVAPVIRDGRALLPLRDLAQYLGLPVRWQPQGNIAIVGLGAGGGGGTGAGQQP